MKDEYFLSKIYSRLVHSEKIDEIYTGKGRLISLVNINTTCFCCINLSSSNGELSSVTPGGQSFRFMAYN